MIGDFYRADLEWWVGLGGGVRMPPGKFKFNKKAENVLNMGTR